MITKKRKKSKKKRPYEPIINYISSGAGNVVIMAINLEKRCPEHKNEKEEKYKKTEKMRIKIENLMGHATIAGEKCI